MVMAFFWVDIAIEFAGKSSGAVLIWICASMEGIHDFMILYEGIFLFLL
jgi:hypothetical protein